MLKKLLILLALLLPLGAAWAAVDVNTATETQLQDLKGIGPSTARAIVKERTDHGPYKNADDLTTRVKGLGPKSLTKLQEQGLAIGSSGSPAAASTVKSGMSMPAPAAAAKTASPKK
jgi:competence protein ComEA